MSWSSVQLERPRAPPRRAGRDGRRRATWRRGRPAAVAASNLRQLVQARAAADDALAVGGGPALAVDRHGRRSLARGRPASPRPPRPRARSRPCRPGTASPSGSASSSRSITARSSNSRMNSRSAPRSGSHRHHLVEVDPGLDRRTGASPAAWRCGRRRRARPGSACVSRRRSRRRWPAPPPASRTRCSSWVAVFSPIPGTPGMLSEVSPAQADQVGDQLRRHAVALDHRVAGRRSWSR